MLTGRFRVPSSLKIRRRDALGRVEIVFGWRMARTLELWKGFSNDIPSSFLVPGFASLIGWAVDRAPLMVYMWLARIFLVPCECLAASGGILTLHCT